MLILVSGTGDEYCDRIVPLLQRQAHRVVVAASAAARSQFLARASPDAVIVWASPVREVPTDLVQAVGVRRTPAALLASADEPGIARFREVGFECFDDGDDFALVANWLRTLRP